MPALDSTQTAEDWSSITPSDTAKIEPTPRAVYVGAAGNLVAESVKGNSVTFAVLAGQVLEIQPVLIKATGTTATGLVALY